MAPLPRIAFFHGGGSTALISQLQCSALQLALSNSFEFVFFDAPFERDAGPGILPFFTYEKFGPYRTWFSKDLNGVERPDGREAGNKMMESEDGIERVIRMMKERRGGGEWVACMGFSQGTRIVGGLLLEQQRLREAGLPGLGNGTINFRFGVLCMGSGGPMVADSSSCEFYFAT
jgi:predicted esterase